MIDFGSSTRKEVFNVLLNESFLSAKEIFNKLKKNSNVSYSFVHRLLKDLVNEKILIESDKKYSFNLVWVQNQRNYFIELEKKLISNNVSSNESILLNYDSYLDFTKNLINVLFEERKNNPKGICLAYLKNLYWVWGCSLSDLKKLNFLGKHGGLILTSSNSFGNKLLSKFYSSIGYKVKINSKYSNNHDFIVYNDLIYQIFLSEKQKQEIKKLYSKKSNPIHYPEKLFEEKGKIQVLIFKNKQLAEKLKKETLELFGEKNA